MPKPIYENWAQNFNNLFKAVDSVILNTFNMSKNNSIQKADLSEVINSAIKLYFNYTSTSSANLTEFFDDELYRDTVAWQHFVAPTITAENNAALTKMSKRVTMHLNFANRIYLEVVRIFRNKFTDEQFRCIVQATITYQTYEMKAYYNVREHIHDFIRQNSEDYSLLGNLQSYKSRISRTSLFEFEILMGYIVLLLEDNKPEQIFDLIKTM